MTWVNYWCRYPFYRICELLKWPRCCHWWLSAHGDLLFVGSNNKPGVMAIVGPHIGQSSWPVSYIYIPLKQYTTFYTSIYQNHFPTIPTCSSFPKILKATPGGLWSSSSQKFVFPGSHMELSRLIICAPLFNLIIGICTLPPFFFIPAFF